MERNYKMALPSDTVNRIRNILNDVGLMSYEKYWKTLNGQTFSCGVNLEGNDYIMTLGKGMDQRYCLASAYGELMERVQNLIIFAGRVGSSINKVVGLFSDTKEIKSYKELELLNEGQSKESVKKVCRDIALDLENPFPESIVAGQYYDLINDEVVYLPYSEMLRVVRSNGMCAGNTFSEAVIEGICEIVERLAIKQIFVNDVVPPSIPREYLEQFSSYNTAIKQLEKQGLRVDIRDCSMGEGYPVLGLVVINEKTGQYKYNFGSHPMFNHALNRCLGEICQVSGGVNSIEELMQNAIDINLLENPYEEDEKGLKNFKLANFYKALKNSNGKLPPCFFSDKNSYEFKEWKAFNKSTNYDTDLKIFIEIFKNNNKHIFVRDVSFLGFPTYQVYITEYSPVQADESFMKNKVFTKERKTNTNLVRLFSKISTCTKDECMDLINYLKITNANAKYFYREVENNWLEELLAVPIKKDVILSGHYILAMLFLKVGDYDEAYKEYSIFFKSGYFDFNNRARFTIMKEYIDCLRRGYDLENSTKILRRCYNENDVKDVINKVSNPSTILREIKILDFIDTDNYNNIMHTFNIIKKCVKGNPINQSAIKDYIRESIVV